MFTMSDKTPRSVEKLLFGFNFFKLFRYELQRIFLIFYLVNGTSYDNYRKKLFKSIVSH